MEMAEKERKEKEEQQKAIKKEVILNKKVQMRIHLERMEEARVASQASEGVNDETHVEGHAPDVEQQGTEEPEIRHGLTEVILSDYV